MGKLIKDGVVYAGSPSNAMNIRYDNTSSNISATNVQGALNDLDSRIGEGGGISLTWEEFNALSEEEQMNGLYYITDYDMLGEAELVSYDNTKSGLTSEDVQSAIDEVANGYLPLIGGELSNPLTIAHESGNATLKLNRKSSGSQAIITEGNNAVNIATYEVSDDHTNSRYLKLSNGKKDELDKAFMINDWVDGVSKNYYIYGEHNPPACNNNILINSNFTNPVNQRGFSTSHSQEVGTSGYWIDRWKTFTNADGTLFEMNNGFISINRSNATSGVATLVQHVEFAEKFSGKKITYSAKVRLTSGMKGLMYCSDVRGDTASIDIGGTGDWKIVELKAHVDPNNINTLSISFMSDPGSVLDIEWVKAELGDVATPYVPRLYTEEWMLCQRYYQAINLRNAYVVEVATNYVAFIIQYLTRMRTTPTMTINSSNKLQANGNTQSGFTFTNGSIYTEFGWINAEKTSHGLSTSTPLSMTSSVYLDAEI